MFNIKNKGFTLIELIVVIGIIGVMASAVMAVLNPFEQFKKSTDSRIKSDLSQIQKGLELYYQDKGHYPANSVGTYKIVDETIGTVEWGSNWIANGTSYMNILPKDPSSSNHYAYYSNGQSYFLYANLTRGAKDPQICHPGNGSSACDSIATNSMPSTACGAVCNFGVTSPDKQP